MIENRFKLLRVDELEKRRDKDPKCDFFTQAALSSELYQKCHYYISPSKIKKLESDTKGVKIDPELLLAYKNFFHVSIDWLIDPNVDTKFLDGSVAVTSKTTGLSDDALKTLSRLKEGSNTDTFFNTLNYIIGADTSLFINLINAIELYLDKDFDTPMQFNGSIFTPINDGISNSSLLNTSEKSILIGKYDPSLCNNSGGYQTKAIPISILKEAYSIQAIEKILNYLKNKKGEI